MNTLLHFIPIATTALSVFFIITLMKRAKARGWPAHLVWWAVGVFFYGVGTALESTITMYGNTLMLNRLWYWAGAILGAYPLATGSVYLLHKRKTANILTGVSLVLVIVASVGVFLTPLVAANLDIAKPDGNVIGWSWIRFPMTPVINIYAAIFLIGGAVVSSVRFFEMPEMRLRAYGTALVAIGATLPGIGGTMAKIGTSGSISEQGVVEVLYIGEFFGLILMWWGFELCTRSPRPVLGCEGDQTRAMGSEGGDGAGNSSGLGDVVIEHKPDLVAVHLGDKGTDT